MNKYFLSLMSILILFQSFKVLDEIFYHEEKDIKKGFVVLEEENDDKNEEIVADISSETEIADLDSLFQNTSIERGIKIARQCNACHDFSNNLKIKVGPPLWGVVGRKVAIISDFKYSEALTNYNKSWTRKELYNFLNDPKNYIQGTKMIYKGLPKKNDRVNLISYLESLK